MYIFNVKQKKRSGFGRNQSLSEATRKETAKFCLLLVNTMSQNEYHVNATFRVQKLYCQLQLSEVIFGHQMSNDENLLHRFEVIEGYRGQTVKLCSILS